MTREIKFRAWTGVEIRNVRSIDFSMGFIECSKGYVQDLEDVILLQYTGLKDNNDKEIYEGDIVHFEKPYKNAGYTFNGYVFWCEDRGRWMHTYTDGRPSKAFWADKSIEVIGNIYETPELLEGEEE